MNSIVPFINEHKVNWAVFTPSLITLIRPESIPGVRTVVLGGEAVTQENVRIWASKVTLINGYGPAETTICAVGPLPEVGWKQGTIGHVTGGMGWITMPNDPSRIAPIGAVGELLIEGAVVTPGYLNDTEKTAAAYIVSPPWRYAFPSGLGQGKLYRSGDLFQYNSNGTFRYVGRRDTQVKLRGQRIELGEIEENLRQLFPDALDVIAEVVIHQNSPSIMAFIANAHVSTTSGYPDKSGLFKDLFSVPDEGFLTRVNAATVRLRQSLPSYMVPAVFLQVLDIPRNTSDKADRKGLREQAAALSREQIRQFSTFASIKREPITEKEKAVQSLWADLFKIPSEQIGADDNFFHLGGDSIIAMRLAMFARRQGLRLPVSYIFDHPVLSDLATFIGDLSSNGPTSEYRPGSLLLGITDLESFTTQNLAASSLPFETSNVIDILPTTEVQSQLLEAKNVTYSRLYLPTRVDPEQIEASCRAIVRKHAILRTIFVPYQCDILQVVLRTIDFEMSRLHCDEDVTDFSEKICSQDSATKIDFGTPHFWPFLISRSESEHMLVLRMTHAQYDGGSFPLISKDFTSAYNNCVLHISPLSFAQYLQFRTAQKTPGTYDFWQQYLSGSQMIDIRTKSVLPQADFQDEFLVKPLRDIPVPSTPEGIIMASLVKGAWSIVLAKMTKRSDVVFGNIISGRDAPLEDIETVSGPTVTKSPLRVTFQRNWTFKDLLHHVQIQYTRTMPFANIDFKDIVKHSTTWSPKTDFSSVVTHQNGNFDLTCSINGVTSQWKNLDFGIPTNFNVVTYPNEGRLYIQFAVSSKTIGLDAANEMIDVLCKTISEISENPMRDLYSLDSFGAALEDQSCLLTVML